MSHRHRCHVYFRAYGHRSRHVPARLSMAHDQRLFVFCDASSRVRCTITVLGESPAVASSPRPRGGHVCGLRVRYTVVYRLGEPPRVSEGFLLQGDSFTLHDEGAGHVIAGLEAMDPPAPLGRAA